MKNTLPAVLAAVLFLGACSDDSSEPAATMEATPALPSIDQVASAMGLDGVDAVTLSGSAWRIRNSFRQTLSASPPWPERDDISNWVQTIDFSAPAMIASGDTFASNLFLEPPVAGVHRNNVAADTTSWGRQLEIWLTPWGFVKGAQQQGAQAETAMLDGMPVTRFSWQSPDSMVSPSGRHYTVNGYVNADNLVVRTETWVEDAFMGDLHVAENFADYRSHNGLMVPASIEQQRAGGGVFGVTVAAASANPADLAALMTPPQNTGGGGFGGPPGGGEQPDDLTEQVGEGVWLVNGAYVSMVVEYPDYLVVIEAGQSESRGEQILAQIREHISDKEIRYIVNSHPHSDHTGGLVPFIREGATLVTHDNNVDFLRMALSTPRTLLGEETLQPQVMGVSGVGMLGDATTPIELHSVPNLHTDGMLVPVLPNAGIMFEADFTLPQPGAEANPFVKTLARYVRDNDVQFDRFLAVHADARELDRDDLLATIAGE